MKLSLFIATLVSVSLAGCFANSEGPSCPSETAEEGCGLQPPQPLPANVTCASATCESPSPICPAGEVPVIDTTDGCYTGDCIAAESCDVAPACNLLNSETQCLDREECDATYGGINCRDPQGNACDANGDASTCTCEAFVFARCDQAAT